MKKLIIVESPNKIKKIKEILGDEYKVEASMGHIMDLAKGGTKGIGIDVNNNFKPYYTILKDKLAVVDNIINAAANVDEILLCTDEDREGHRIAYDLSQILKSTGKPMFRAEFNEITKSGIEKGIKNKHEINMNMVRAQEARRILDRIVGFMVSPYLINTYGHGLSAGRVQSVAVRMIVDREDEIKDFKPEEYHNIHCKFSTNNKENFIAKFEPKVSTTIDANNLISLIKEKNDFYVAKVQSQKKKEKPLPPLTTAKLQQYMAKKYGLDADATMRSAQNLYENGYCTYIRTDSTRASDEAVKEVRKYLKEIKFDVPKTANIYAAKGAAQDAHECIRPTDISVKPDGSFLAGNDKDVYTAIWQHFLASQIEAAIWSTLSVKIISRSDKKLSFRVSGKALEYKGFLEIFGNIELSKIEIPNLKENDNLIVLDLKSEQKYTQPPPRYNNSSFLKELEDRQIGRPSTYAEIIKKISNRNYVEFNGATYRATDLGKKITDILTNLFEFMQYEYTADLEKKLDEISIGNIELLNVLKEFFIPFKKKLDAAYVSAGNSICEKCGCPMVLRTNSKDQTQFRACSGWPKCKNNVSIERKS
jgi:DNA topoisomerase-1